LAAKKIKEVKDKAKEESAAMKQIGGKAEEEEHESDWS